MKVNLYKRHGSNCRFRKPGDKQDKDRAHRCQCSVWLEYRVNGVQKRETTKQAGVLPKKKPTRLRRCTKTRSLDAGQLQRRQRA